MLLDINKSYLELVRGDTLNMPLPLNCGSREYFQPYALGTSDYLFIGIMRPGQPFEEAVVRCKLDCHSPRDAFGNSIFRLAHEDTKNLEPGKYYITIKFVNNDDVITLVDQKLFFITGSNVCCGGDY